MSKSSTNSNTSEYSNVSSSNSVNSNYEMDPNLVDPNLVDPNLVNTIKYDSQCIRQKTNFSKFASNYVFDSESFDPKTLRNDIPKYSPKLNALLQKIKELDKRDLKKEGKLYKHFIFSDFKSSRYGAKLLAAAFIANGFNLGYSAPKKTNGKPLVQSTPILNTLSSIITPFTNPAPADGSRGAAEEEVPLASGAEEKEVPSASGAVVEEVPAASGAEEKEVLGGAAEDTDIEYKDGKVVKKVKIWGKLELHSDEKLKQTPNTNFYLLSSIGVYDNPINVSNKKAILKKFNQRPENIQGEDIRFIIMDSGFKEGIDLFDIKYIHIFEPPQTAADQKQVIGRGTRTCGQKGLTFHPVQGWPLYVYIYDLSIPPIMQSAFLQSSSAFDFYLKSMNLDLRLYNFMDDLEKMTILGSVDYELNNEIHNFKPTKNSILRANITADLHSSWSMTDKEMNPSTKGYVSTKDSNLQRFKIEYEESMNSNSSSSSSRSTNQPSVGSNISSLTNSLDSSQWTDEESGGGPKRIIIDKTRSPLIINTQSKHIIVDEDKSPLIINTDSYNQSNTSTLGKAILGKKVILRKPCKTCNVPVPINPFQPSLPHTSQRLDYTSMKDYIQEYYSEFAWTNIKMENLCEEKPKTTSPTPSKGGAPYFTPTPSKGGASQLIQFTPTQEFIKHYFTPTNPCKGMLLWHSVGTGKTCSAIAAATSSFERQGYTILWVTRTTLKTDIWKNMYDQVCSESIRNMIDRGIDIPSDNNKRMRLLSKSWKIRPMSYKQFSNLVSKQNNLYHNLVKINGEIDPLRKTLLIIDEAHKLYGGNDLSSLERPNMEALKESIMNSYHVSGQDSVKLMLMTATPITQSPMEIIKLINLCKPIDEQMPDEFATFSENYLSEDGTFRKDGRDQYLDDIAGYVSYLNREKDARQFSQPHIEFIRPSIITNEADVKRFDRKLVREYLDSDISDLKKKIVDANSEIDEDFKDLNAAKFGFLLEPCKQFEDNSSRKTCIKIVRKNIRELVIEAKEQIKHIDDSIKEIKEDIKNKNLFKRDTLQQIKDNLDTNPEEYEEFKKTAYYNIKYKCGKRLELDSDFIDALQTHPKIMKLNSELSEIDAEINLKLDKLKIVKNEYKFKIKQMSDMLKTNISPVEKTAIRLTIADARKTAKLLIADKRKTANKEITELKLRKHEYEIKKTKRMKNTKKQLKLKIRENVMEEKEQSREILRAKKELEKTLRSQGHYDEIKNDTLNGLVSKYTQKMKDEYFGSLDEIRQKQQNKQDLKIQKKTRCGYA